MTPSVIRSNAKKYLNSEALTETYEFPDRSHFTGVEPGWEQVADYALAWATSHARTPPGRQTAANGNPRRLVADPVGAHRSDGMAAPPAVDLPYLTPSTDDVKKFAGTVTTHRAARY
jgi:hypothetical protein